MLPYPEIDPVIFSIGPLSVQWYGLMYVFGFLSAWFLAKKRLSKPDAPISIKDFEDLFSYAIIGVALGARLGYVFFYQPAYYFSNPSQILAFWEGGMSFHGGLLGVIFAATLFGYRKKISLYKIFDFLAILTPPGLFFGRLGNFINGELWGRVTLSPLGMVFPHGGELPRYPTQLYEAILEGLVLFAILWIYSNKKRAQGHTAGLFLICYGSMRFLIEFIREPDAFLGFLLFNWVSMGQILSLPMILIGLVLFFRKDKMPQDKISKS